MPPPPPQEESEPPAPGTEEPPLKIQKLDSEYWICFRDNNVYSLKYSTPILMCDVCLRCSRIEIIRLVATDGVIENAVTVACTVTR